jgi:hypothetical protein
MFTTSGVARLRHMTSDAHLTHRELDSRSGDGLDIRLLWNPDDDSVTVTVADVRTQELFVIPVAARDAAAAFQHPFAYAA